MSPRRRRMYRGIGAAGVPGAAAGRTQVGSDPFSSDTSANYVSGGDVSMTWVWSGGFVQTQGAAGMQATLVRSGFTAANSYVETDANQAEDGGLLLRYQDNNNYYLLTLHDSSAATSVGGLANGYISLFKRVAGVFSQLVANTALATSWVRGVDRTFSLQIGGSTLSAFDGLAPLFTTSDGAIASAGSIGLRANGNPPDKYDALRWGTVPVS